MGIEIERKFLVEKEDYRRLSTPVRMVQGYFPQAAGSALVRVRIAGEKAWLTIKGENVGLTRDEFEYEIPRADAEALLGSYCEPPLIEKHRYNIDIGTDQWVIDEFTGANAGLVLAEIELNDEQQSFNKPEWIGPEVSHDPRFFNSQLQRQPIRDWAPDWREKLR